MDYHGTTALHLACQRGHGSAAVSWKIFFHTIELNQMKGMAQPITMVENSAVNQSRIE